MLEEVGSVTSAFKWIEVSAPVNFAVYWSHTLFCVPARADEHCYSEIVCLNEFVFALSFRLSMVETDTGIKL